jgi:hypothetical protein
VIRDDLSSRLVHLIRGDSIEEAVKKFESILEERMLRGGTGFIRGGYRCVCFTETPISKLGYVLSSPDLAEMRYRPFGIMLEKRYVFDLGGRPAIYQPDSDYEKLPEELRYQSTEVKPAHPQHALKLKAGCGFGFGGLGLDRPGLCL